MTTRMDDGVEDRLREFFQQETPKPWPGPPTVASSPAPRMLRFGRLALVASVGLVLAGYLMLASFFPSRTNPGLNPGQNPHIGQRPQVPSKVEPK